MCAKQLTDNTALQDLQRNFLAQIVTPDALCLPSFSLGSSKVLPEQSWAIYRRNYLESHVAALASTYTNVLKLVGDAYFRQLARRYVMQTSSRHGDLNHYGADFADFIADILPTAPNGAALAYLPDMARLDWAWFEVLRAPIGASNWFAQLQNTAEENWSQLRAKPACKILSSPFPIYQIWLLNENTTVCSHQTKLDITPPETVLIARPNQVEVINLTPAEAIFINTWLAENQAATLENALEAALLHDEQFDFAATLMLLARLNAIHSIHTLEYRHD